MTPVLALLALLIPAAAGPTDDGPAPLDVAEALERSVTGAIERARPSVVTIDRIKSEDGVTRAVRRRERAPEPPQDLRELAVLRMQMQGVDRNPVGPLGEDFRSYDYASGVVVGDEGETLTTHHAVVGAELLYIRAAGHPPMPAEILAADPRSDLAVVAPIATGPLGGEATALRPIPMADADGLRPGTFLLALGNAYNTARDGQASASFGILANTARRLLPPRNDFDQIEVQPQLQHYSTLLQLDSKLNLGMSGGAVVNLRGELVAITTASANAVGYDPRAGYAIPLDRIGRRAVEALIDGREVEYGFLGITLQPPANVVELVQPGTPAGEGGLVQGDAIVRVGQTSVEDFDSLIRAVNSQPVGAPVELLIRRGTRELTKEVVLSKFPVEGQVIATNRPRPWRGAMVDFSSVIGPTVDSLEAMARGGVVVTEVAPGSPAEAAGLRTGLIVATVAGKPVRTPAAFREAVAEYEGEPVELGTDRGPLTVEPLVAPDED